MALAQLATQLPPSGPVSSGLVATPAGTQATALLLPSVVNYVGTVATAADAVKLGPAPNLNDSILVVNQGAASMQVFGSGTDTINGVATATGVAQAAGVAALYLCTAVGAVDKWNRFLQA
jgi:hypothetical protein